MYKSCHILYPHFVGIMYVIYIPSLIFFAFGAILLQNWNCDGIRVAWKKGDKRLAAV